MGFHSCKYCIDEGRTEEGHKFNRNSSGDVRVRFNSGRAWEFPHSGLLHYITSHNFLPPAEFIEDVMENEIVPVEVWSDFEGTRIGYLAGDFPTGNVPPGLADRILRLVQILEQIGNYHVVYTRGV